MVQFTDSGSCYLYDLDSRNGTLVNGRRVSVPTMLRHGDRIAIGPYTLGFVHEQPDQVAPDGVPSAAPDTHVNEEQQVTTVVVNIRDYADLERRVGAPRLAVVVAALHHQARPILEDMGAWTQKYFGPAILAIWVHRSIKPPLNVVLSAFESVSRIARAAAELQAQFGLDVAVRVSAGIETGKTSLDNLDSRGSADLAALDDAVNRAFRIDFNAKDPDREVAFGAATGEILLQGVALAEVAQQRSVALDGTAEPTSLWVMSLDSLSRMLGALPQRTVRIALP
jgi:adenylate cyclase